MTTIYKPFYIPKECLGYVFKTNFHQEFDDADHEGVEAVKETYQRICNKNKDNIGILGELQIVLNSRLCFWEQKLNKFRNFGGITNRFKQQTLFLGTKT